jgi:type VI secretion system secreted protein Hcp
MASNQHIKLEGIEGESEDATHKGEIDVLSWSWGMTQSGSFHTGGGGGAGKVSVQDINFIKSVDKSTPLLMNYCATGKPIPTATITVKKAGGDAPLPYMTIELKKILVSSVQTGGGADTSLTESITLHFESYKVIYQKQKEDGSKDGGPVETVWNIKQNKAV